MGDPALALGLPGGIEVRNRGNRDSGWPGIARAFTETTGSRCVGGRDDGSLRHSPDPRRIRPAIAAADIGRIVLWTLFVAVSCHP